MYVGIEGVVKWHERKTNDMNVGWVLKLPDGRLNVGFSEDLALVTLEEVGVFVKVTSVAGYTYIHQNDIVAFVKGLAFCYAQISMRELGAK